MLKLASVLKQMQCECKTMLKVVSLILDEYRTTLTFRRNFLSLSSKLFFFGIWTMDTKLFGRMNNKNVTIRSYLAILSRTLTFTQAHQRADILKSNAFQVNYFTYNFMERRTDERKKKLNQLFYCFLRRFCLLCRYLTMEAPFIQQL